MQIKHFKIGKYFNYKFEEPIEVQQIDINIGSIDISITEHQYGQSLNEPHIDINYDGISYSMSLKDFIEYGLKGI